jgi:hypothetical protein
MLHEFLLPETSVREAGTGSDIDLGSQAGGTLLLTLGITRILEQQSLDISIWGSADGTDWGARPIASFPQKFYCGTYHVELDLTGQPQVHYLRAKWQVNRWGRGDSKPLFTIYLFAQAAQSALVTASA